MRLEEPGRFVLGYVQTKSYPVEFEQQRPGTGSGLRAGAIKREGLVH